MHDLNDLYFFVQVVEHGGFSAAGRALDIPKSRLSRRIAGLEERLDARLIQRTTRQFSVTAIGQVYYEHCKAMLIEAQAAQEAIDARRVEPRGIVRITCPIALLHAEAGRILLDFMVAYPQVDLQLEATNRRVDLVAEGVDVALRVRRPPLEDSDLVLRVLARRSQCLVGSPALFGRQALPETPDDLATWPGLQAGGPHERPVWQLMGPDHNELVISYTPHLVTGDFDVLRQAALAGLGVVQLPRMLIRNELRQGLLLELLPGWAPAHEMVHAVFPSRRGLLPAVRALIDFLAGRYEALGDD